MWWRKAKAAAPVADAGVSKADHEAAIAAARAAGRTEGIEAGRAEYDADVAAARAEGLAAGLSDGEKKGRADALSRAVAILSLPEARGRMAQAIMMLEMDISVEVAPRILSAIPATRPTTPAPVPPLDRRGAAPLH